MNECPECAEPGGAHLPGCSLAAFEDRPAGVAAPAPVDPRLLVLTEIRDEVRLLRRVVSYGLVLLVLWMLVWAVVAGTR